MATLRRLGVDLLLQPLERQLDDILLARVPHRREIDVEMLTLAALLRFQLLLARQQLLPRLLLALVQRVLEGIEAAAVLLDNPV